MRVMRLHMICGALLIGFCAHAQQKSASAQQQGGEKTVKLKVPPLPPSTEQFLVAQLADAKWTPANKIEPKMPAGADVALIGADPVSTGPTTYLRMKPGYKIPMNWSIHLQYTTVIAGKGTFTVDGKKIPASPGTFIVIPSRAKHDFACDAGAECIFVTRRSGPTDFNLVTQ